MKTRLLRKIRRDFIVEHLDGVWYGLSKKNKALVFSADKLSVLLADIAWSYYEQLSYVLNHWARREERRSKKKYQSILRKINSHDAI